MTVSPELTRFLADHATAESQAAFANGLGTAPTAAAVAAAMTARGYQVGEADLVAALALARQSALNDQQLDGVVGGQGTYSRDDLVNTMSTAAKAVEDKLAGMKQAVEGVDIRQMFEMQTTMNMLTQLSDMSTNVVSASNAAIGNMARNVKG